MTASDTSLHLPPRLTRQDGAVRHVGVELELIGLELDALSAIVADHLGGTVVKQSRYEHRICGDPRGDWAVEMDFEFLKEKGRRAPRTQGFIAEMDAVAEELVRAGAKRVVPFEIVSPPLPMDRLGEMESLIERLRQAGAQGSKAKLAYAFGLHFNPELPATDAATILHYLQAFLCLFDWLAARSKVDWTRRLTVFVDPFPKGYVRTVIDPDYRPDSGALIDDYLRANPTRNRALDMLPLFMHLDPQRVRAVIDDPRIKPRPTLHYRLPNCEISQPGWGLYRAWDNWLQVEHLAGDAARLERLCRDYTRFLDRPFAGLLHDWTQQVESCLKADSDL